MAAERPGAEVWATDADAEALDLAAANRERTGVAVTLCRGDWYGALPDRLRGRVDLVVSNPPYVSEAEWPALDAEVRHEPRAALVAGPGTDGTPGLAGSRRSSPAPRPGWPPGAGRWWSWPPTRRPPAAKAARRAGLEEVAVVPDLAGRDRAVTGRAPAGRAAAGPVPA